MLESQLELGNKLKQDRETVYEQMKKMKYNIQECSKLTFKTEGCKDSFDAFKQNLLETCDKWVENERKSIDENFSKI